ncbi:MAG TPA: type I-F CRISPR-associated protein Csy1, partial [Salinisphaera sp.]|nr:type I-F CRISPR-associated protein Csy1 [Salinisphaera sp.]
MHAHIAQRLEKELKKWEGKTDSQSRSKAKDAREKYILKNILNKGSASTSGIAVATHIAKGIHPDLSIKRATNLNIQPNELPARNEVGSHLLPPKESLADTTGNGA